MNFIITLIFKIIATFWKVVFSLFPAGIYDFFTTGMDKTIQRLGDNPTFGILMLLFVFGLPALLFRKHVVLYVVAAIILSGVAVFPTMIMIAVVPIVFILYIMFLISHGISCARIDRQNRNQMRDYYNRFPWLR